MNLIRTVAAALSLSLVASLALADAASTQPSYPLKVDVMTGEALPAGGGIVEHVDGREVHFASKESAEQFKAGGEKSQAKMDELIVAAQAPTYASKMCPISDEKLGEMGKPVMFVDRSTNRLIELCCKGCLKKAKADPAAALKKVDAEASKG